MDKYLIRKPHIQGTFWEKFLEPPLLKILDINYEYEIYIYIYSKFGFKIGALTQTYFFLLGKCTKMVQLHLMDQNEPNETE